MTAIFAQKSNGMLYQLCADGTLVKKQWIDTYQSDPSWFGLRRRSSSYVSGWVTYDGKRARLIAIVAGPSSTPSRQGDPIPPVNHVATKLLRAPGFRPSNAYGRDCSQQSEVRGHAFLIADNKLQWSFRPPDPIRYDDDELIRFSEAIRPEDIIRFAGTLTTPHTLHKNRRLPWIAFDKKPCQADFARAERRWSLSQAEASTA